MNTPKTAPKPNSGFLAGRASMREENERLRVALKDGLDMADSWECSCNFEYKITCWRCEFIRDALEALQPPAAGKGEE
jgi:hypothetical protein